MRSSSPSSLLIGLFFLAGSLCQTTTTLKVTEPRAAHWWIADSLNTLSWSGESGAPQQFSVFLNNPDPNVLTSKYALISLYEYSKTVNPGGTKPATGYTIELTDTLNSSNIYATSEVFEIKAVNSPYPPQDDGSTASPTASGSSQSGQSATSISESATQSAASVSQTGGAYAKVMPNMAVAAVAGVGGVALLL